MVIASASGAEVMRVVYSLDGTHFDIRNTPLNLGDGTYEIGPGEIIIDYTVQDGLIVDGPVTLRSYALIQDFTTSTSNANVDADLYSEANFSGAQTSAAGMLSGGVITWSQSFPYKVSGTNTCTGSFCGLAGFEQGVPRDESREDPVTFAPFRFGSGGPQAGRGFDGDELLLPGNDGADTYLLLEAHEVRRKRVDETAPDPCLAYPAEGAHTGDGDCDGSIGLGELLRVVQLYNAGTYRCDASGAVDSYRIGGNDTSSCVRHTADYLVPAFHISLTELLRVVQWFNLGALSPCSDVDSLEGESLQDGFCPADEG